MFARIKEGMFRKVGKNEKGFTLAELLIVVAIIGVLVAISIPIFTKQLEKSREATDQANLRSAYAEVMAAGLSEDTANYTKTVTAKQTDTSKWESGTNPDVGGISVDPAASWTVAYNATDATVTITGATGSGSTGG